MPDNPERAAPAAPAAWAARVSSPPAVEHPLRRYLVAATVAHVLWAVALVPYGIAAIALLRGVDEARTWVGSPATLAFWVAALAVVLLPLNLIAATLGFWLDPKTIRRRALVVSIFAFGWFDFGGLAAAAGGGFVIEAAVWAGLAGLVYGLVVLRLIAAQALR